MLAFKIQLEEPRLPTGSSLAGVGTAGVAVLHILLGIRILDILTFPSSSFRRVAYGKKAGADVFAYSRIDAEGRFRDLRVLLAESREIL